MSYFEKLCAVIYFGMIVVACIIALHLLVRLILALLEWWRG